MAFAQVREIKDVKVFLGMNIVITNHLQFTYNSCTGVTRGVVPIVSVCQQFQSDHTVNQTVTYIVHIHALIHNYRIFVIHKIVKQKLI